jgi:hypothetical protein
MRSAIVPQVSVNWQRFTTDTVCEVITKNSPYKYDYKQVFTKMESKQPAK